MKLKRTLLSLTAFLSIGVLLSGCEDSDDSAVENGSQQTNHKVHKDSIGGEKADPTTYEEAKSKAKSHDEKIYKLAFFDYIGNSDTDKIRYRLGYYNKGQLYYKTLNSDNNDFYEIVAPNLQTPYVEVDNGDDVDTTTYFIHRPPNNMYNQPIVKGKITDKLK